MDTRTPPPTGHHAAGVASARFTMLALVACFVAVATTGRSGDAPSTADPSPPEACCTAGVPAAVLPDPVVRPIDTAPGGIAIHEHRSGRIARGGIAARLHDDDNTPIVGDVFLLMADSSSDRAPRVYDRIPYTHDNGAHPETVESNRVAAQIVATTLGSDVELLELTGAAAGGPSAGITYAIAYLNIVSDGAFTGGLRVAATGRIEPGGHIGSIDSIDAKAAAAHLAGADVLFTPTVPTSEVGDTHGARLVGESNRDPNTGVTLSDPRRLALFQQWGASRPDGMDIVDTRHLIDVAAYLCGTGSTYACHITELLEVRAQQRVDQLQDEALAESDRLRTVSR